MATRAVIQRVKRCSVEVDGRRIAETGMGLLVLLGVAAGDGEFTLLAETSRGRRPSFVAAADPALAEPLYQDFVARLRASGLEAATGEFGVMMDVSLDNWGPVTIVLDSPWGAAPGLHAIISPEGTEEETHG